MPEKNATLFFEREVEGELIRFYRSGDMAFQDEKGIFYSTGRKDIQYKIQGFKVELGDIEQHAREFIKKGNAAAEHCNTDDMVGDYMSEKIQGYKFKKFQDKIMGIE